MVLLRFEPRERLRKTIRTIDQSRTPVGISREASRRDEAQTSFSVLLSARDRELLDRGVTVLSFERLRRMVR